MFSLALCAVAAAVFALMAIGFADQEQHLNERGISASATVLEVHGGRGGGYVLAQFLATDGRTVVARVHDYSWNPMPRVGDVATVIYDPQAPEDLVRDARLGGNYPAVWLTAAISVVLGVGGGLFFRRSWSYWRDNAEAWRHGDNSS